MIGTGDFEIMKLTCCHRELRVNVTNLLVRIFEFKTTNIFGPEVFSFGVNSAIMDCRKIVND